jgi:hypothetical protein
VRSASASRRAIREIGNKLGADQSDDLVRQLRKEKTAGLTIAIAERSGRTLFGTEGRRVERIEAPRAVQGWSGLFVSHAARRPS